MKTCARCHLTLPSHKFGLKSRSKDNLHEYCRSCVAERRKEYKEEHPLFDVFKNMRERCNNSARHEYINWGGRGIKCMFNTLKEFEEYAMPLYEQARVSYGRKVELCIDRINVNGHYEKGNIRFISRQESSQNKSRRRIRRIEPYYILNNQQYTLQQLSKLGGLPSILIRRRLLSGWSVERATFEPVNKKPQTEVLKQRKK